jgi:hypothetical protein
MSFVNGKRLRRQISFVYFTTHHTVEVAAAVKTQVIFLSKNKKVVAAWSPLASILKRE